MKLSRAVGLIGLTLCSSIFVFSACAYAKKSDPDSENGQSEKSEHRGKTGAAFDEADSQYDLAKARYAAGDLANSEQMMRQALDAESKLTRPLPGLRVRVALALILAAEHKYSAALDAYQEALAHAQRCHLDDQVATLYDSMGALALVSGKYDQADQLFIQAAARAEKEGNFRSQANALVNQAIVARARNQNDRAQSLLQMSIDLLKDKDEAKILGAAYAELGRVLADTGKYDQALGFYDQAARLYQSELDGKGEGKVLVSNGQVLLLQKKFDKAQEVFGQARKLFEEDKDRGGIIDSLTGQGSACAGSGDYAAAQKSFDQALSMANATGAGARQRSILAEIGYAQLLQGLPEKALGSFTQAYDLLQRQEPDNQKTKGVLLCDIAMSYKAIGQAAAAIADYDQAVSAFQLAGDKDGEATALNSLAVVYLDAGATAEFEKYYDQAKQAYAVVSDARGQAVLEYNFAQYEMMRGHYADAIPHYQTALDAMRPIGDAAGQGEVISGLGLAYLYLGRASRALELYQQALPLANSSGGMEAKWDCELGLGKCYKALGQDQEAVVHLTRAVELVEKERRQLSRDASKTFDMDLRQDCFGELIDVLSKMGRIEDSLQVAERGRARAFLDLLQGRQSHMPNQMVSDTQGSAKANPTLLSGLPGTRAVEIVPRASAVVETSAISSVNADPPSLLEIKSLVARRNSEFIEYYVLPDKVLIWVVHPDGRIEMPPPIVISNRELTDKIAKTNKSVIAGVVDGKSPSEVAQDRENNLKDLYKLLFEPVRAYLSKQTPAPLTIVPQGPIFSVPFAALMQPNSRFLAEDYDLSYTPAIGVLRATQMLSSQRQHDSQTLLAFGNPVTKAVAFLGALPYAEKEVQDVAQVFGPDKSQVFTGEQATRNAFEQMAPKASVIHLATHGLIDEEHPMDSAVLLAPSGKDNGLLTVKDILQLPSLNSNLVVLSACQTARGKITGDGVVGLSRSFIIAGTPSIIVSQWNVDDVLTEYQMVAFYKELLKGQTKSKALRQAQLQTIAFMEQAMKTPGSARANPRYWAAFQLIGEAQ